MNSMARHPDNEELRERILLAARERFRQTGFGKTTMVDIATDCACSPANLYRYYASKQDIAAAVCERCMGERVVTLRQLVRTPGSSAAQRLRAYVLEGLKINREQLAEGPKLSELIAHILEQRHDLVHSKVQAQSSLIAEILAYGNETGEFDVDDVINTARTVHAALILFDVPIFQPLFSEAEFQTLANNTVDLLLRGLIRR